MKPKTRPDPGLPLACLCRAIEIKAEELNRNAFRPLSPAAMEYGYQAYGDAFQELADETAAEPIAPSALPPLNAGPEPVECYQCRKHVINALYMGWDRSYNCHDFPYCARCLWTAFWFTLWETIIIKIKRLKAGSNGP